ncbi:MAG: J domain-containing protein [Desulfobacterales bacterium]|nr:J domain-containing protein [Desulfobacterales bacterium]
MEIQRCFDLLEINPNASPEEAKQAYKDIVNVWHPDRFSNNPRLKEKAEEKLKEVNVAYEKVKSYLAVKPKLRPQPDQFSKVYSAATEPATNMEKPTDKGPLRGILSYFSKTLDHLFDTRSLRKSVDSGGFNTCRSGKGPGQGYCGGMGRRMGKGSGRGKGGGRGR